MASIFKQPQGPSKGFIVFTHKERDWLDERAYLIGPLIERLRERWVLGMHWGWFVGNAEHQPFIDVQIGREETVRFVDGATPRRLLFNSSLFMPEYFRVRPEVPKQWDIVAVTRTGKFKNTDQLLQCLKLVLDRRPQTRAIVVCVGPTGRRKGHHNDLAELYDSLFSAEQREQISFNYVRSDRLFPLNRRDIAFLYNASRVFTLFSDTEGVAKVIKEALLCGLPVVAKAHLKGGGEQFFTPKNSRAFTTLEEGAACFVDLLDHPESIQVDAEGLARECSEIHTAPRFERAVRELYAELGIPFAGELNLVNIGRRLSSHVPHEVHDSLRMQFTSDVKDRASMVIFLRHLLDGTPVEAISLPVVDRARLRADVRRERWLRLARSARRRVIGSGLGRHR